MANDKQALSLHWVYGISDVPNNIVNLSDDQNDRVAYAAAHTAVIYDKHTGKQTFLQGHCNAISCMQATAHRSLLITADAGHNSSLLVFWDPATGQPVSTVQQPHASGVLTMAVSADHQQLATLSAPTGDPDSQNVQQEVSVWDLTTVSTHPSQLQPLSTTAVPTGDTQTCITFHPQDPTELVTNGPRRVLFWRQQQQAEQPMNFYSPPLKPTEFQQAVGEFVASAFVPGTSQAVTSTVDGDVIIWEQESMSAPVTAQQAQSSGSRRTLKIIRLHGAAIKHLSSIGNFVVTGGADGLVRMFDGGMRLCAWFESMDAGPITCVSFATKGQQHPSATMHLSSLSAPDFMVSTSTGKLMAVRAESFNTPDPGNPSGCELLMEAPDSCLTHILAHPLRPELLLLATPGSCPDSSSTGIASGSSNAATGASSRQQVQQTQGQMPMQTQRLQRWDLVSQCCLVSRQLPPEQVAVQVVLARDGSFAVLGCAMGQLVVLKGDTLQENVSLRHTKHDIAKLSVSTDGRYVACADTSGQVLLYGFLPHKGAYYKWDLVGKAKAHHGHVVGLHFGEAPGGQTRLFSLGADKRLIEYDLSNCTAANTGLRTLTTRDCVPPGSTGSPCTMCFAPPMPYYSQSSTETLLLVADNAYKIKAYNPDAESAIATATYLGPTYGEPISHLLPFRSVSDSGVTPWLAYSTAERVVGLIKWPLDCDPQSSMGLIAHPGQIRGLVLSFDGRKLITLGTNGVMNVWEVNTRALLPAQPGPAAQAAAAAPSSSSSGSSKPDWEQLVGDAALYEELRDYFCYAQLTKQSLDTTGSFGIDGHVPAAALPDLMRAAGHYPSQADRGSLLAHVRFLADMAPADDATVCSTSGGTDAHGTQQRAAAAAASQVDLDTFLLLYLSHRPVVDVSRQQVEAAFRTLGASTAAGVLSARQLLEMLQTGGEPMGVDELQQVLAAVTGCENPEEALPEFVDAGTFMTEVLGFA